MEDKILPACTINSSDEFGVGDGAKVLHKLRSMLDSRKRYVIYHYTKKPTQDILKNSDSIVIEAKEGYLKPVVKELRETCKLSIGNSSSVVYNWTVIVEDSSSL